MNTTLFKVSFSAVALALLFVSPAYASHEYNSYHNNRWNSGYHNDYSNYNNRTPSCRITVSPNTVGYGGTVRIAWDSDYADSATITDLGSVSPDGNRTIAVYDSKTYYMTVYNGSRSATCSALVNIPGDRYTGNYPYYQSNYQYNQPHYNYPTYQYVPLSRIPYTGGGSPLVTALAWLAVTLTAGAGAVVIARSRFGLSK